MDITGHLKGDRTELFIKGRLDAYWADHLSKELDQYIREGAHHLVLDLSGLEYISSAGIRILVQYNKMLSEINGFFSISRVSEPVKKVLDLIGISEILMRKESKPLKQETTDLQQFEKHGTGFKIFSEDKSGKKPVTCRAIGDPQLLNGARFDDENTHLLSMPPSDYGVGLGCIGKNFSECQDRFGEFIAAAGTTAYMPTDNTNVPDFMMASGTFIPEICFLYGLFFNGDFTHFVLFDAQKEIQSIRFSHLCEEILQIINTEKAAVVMVAETEGLVGTALRAAPVQRNEADIPFKHPRVRKWLSFTSERAYQQNVALITGIVDRSPDEKIQPFVRLLDNRSGLSGHFHASVFPYRPIKIGRLDIHQTVHQLYETEGMQSILHLINDDREFSGAGESEFIRGACWIAPISTYITE